MPKWITFELVVDPSKRVTRIWNIVTIDSSNIIGQIKWYGPWRKYAFYPNGQSVWEPFCLREICLFIDQQMEKRKKGLD